MPGSLQNAAGCTKADGAMRRCFMTEATAGRFIARGLTRCEPAERDDGPRLVEIGLYICEAEAKDAGDIVGAHGHTVDGVRRLDGAAVVRDDDELRAL